MAAAASTHVDTQHPQGAPREAVFPDDTRHPLLDTHVGSAPHAASPRGGAAAGTLSALPPDQLAQCVGFLPLSDLGACAAVCARFRDAVAMPHLWRKFVPQAHGGAE
eukprot:gene9006-52911_t